MQRGTEIGRLIETARLGFKVVPFGMVHDTKGMGLMHCDSKGMRFEPFDKKQTPLVITWAEFDAKKSA